MDMTNICENIEIYGGDLNLHITVYEKLIGINDQEFQDRFLDYYHRNSGILYFINSPSTTAIALRKFLLAGRIENSSDDECRDNKFEAKLVIINV